MSAMQLLQTLERVRRKTVASEEPILSKIGRVAGAQEPECTQMYMRIPSTAGAQIIERTRFFGAPELRSREVRLCKRANDWGASKTIADFFGVISRLGDGVFWYVLMLAIALFGGAKGIFVALQMVLTGLVAAAMYRTLKRWTRRPRPFRTHRDIVPLVLPLDEFSFPSGHTLHAVTFTVIALAWFPLLAPLLIPFALLVAASRVVLGLHYPSDVLAATLIGCGLATTSLWIASLIRF